MADRVLMLENAVYSVVSLEGCASILWNDAGLVAEAATAMKITAEDVWQFGIADQIVPEPPAAPRRRSRPPLPRSGVSCNLYRARPFLQVRRGPRC